MALIHSKRPGMLRSICIDTTGNRNYSDVPVVSKLPEIGSRTDWYPFSAIAYKKFEPVSVPPQRFCKEAENCDFYLVTYEPFNLVKDCTHLIAVWKGERKQCDK